MRNVFDQYEQPENKLTHALVCTLNRERSLIRPFLHWLGIRDIPPLCDLRVDEQCVPGTSMIGDQTGQTGVPDACIYTSGDWAVLFESKVDARVTLDQLRRHEATARRHGHERSCVVVILVERPKRALPKTYRVVEWRDVYQWLSERNISGSWAKILTDYMQVLESRMIEQDYGIRGTLTMFNGLKFDADNPYSYREAKRLIRLLGGELQKRKDLQKLGLDPKGKRRPAITGQDRDRVWDLLPLRVARGAPATAYPHLTMCVFRHEAVAAVTVPNGVKGGFRTRLKDNGVDGFRRLAARMEKRLRPVLRGATGARPMMYAIQRHFKGQRSLGTVDARLDADLRTIVPGVGGGVKPQPQWIDAIYRVLCEKRSNIQFGVEVHFPYDCPKVRSVAAVELFAQTWLALRPLLDFALDG